ncbi:hypothetical protein [Streptomyces sp. NPDC053728]|uniref:hypothetical protein n=1 Tax=unclassified Streptomyces TaxID=2593676 RepID=UPI00344232A7
MVIVWALLTVGGWAATPWLGEPSATDGPGPGPSPASSTPGGTREPGPQPEGPCATPAPSRPSSADPSPLAEVPNAYRDEYAVQVLCDYAVFG